MSLPSFEPGFASPADWARMYRECGLQVVPGYTPQEKPQSWKRPLLSEWTTLQDALVPEISFLRWYGQDGQYSRRENMGLITGRCSDNIFVVDLDDHKTEQARLWWDGLLVTHNFSREPHTWQQRTGGGGRQLFFRGPKDWAAPTNKTPIGVDIRGQGGFAVLPPSLHESGSAYEWAPDCAPWEVSIEDAPSWLIYAVEALVAEHGSGASSGAERTPSPSGDVDAFGARVDGREEYMRDMVWAAVVDWCRECPIEPPEEESRRKMLATYEIYLHGVKSRFPGDAEEGLEREGRGLSLFQDKWARAIGKWEPDVQLAAMERPAQKEKPAVPDEQKTEVATLKATPFAWVEARAIPPREWIYDRHYIRRFVSTTVAPGGLGKSSLITAEALAIASGRPVLGRAIDERVNVWLWNGEDPADELNRRIVATAVHHRIAVGDLSGRLFVDTGRVVPIVIAERTRDGVTINAPLVEQVIKTIQLNNIGLMVIDPFIASHRVSENDNSEIDRVAKTWASIADVTGCAIELVHHVRKTGTNEVGVEDGRGAVALLSAARAARALNRMSAEEGVTAAVHNHRYFFRSDDGKANLAPPSEGARWFQIKSFDLGNATAKRPSDSIGVVESWQWPDPTEGMTAGDVESVREAVRRGNYRADSQAADWVGNIIIERLGLDGPGARGQAKQLQKMWVQNGALMEVEELDEKRKPRRFVRPGKDNL